MRDDLQQILVTKEQLHDRIQELGQEISRRYRGTDEITLVAIINGALIFTADLMRAIELPTRLDCIRVSSYRDSTQALQKPEIIDRFRLDIEDRHVVLIDDILDTGNTLSQVVKIMRELNPRSLRTCVLLEKKGRREVEFSADWVGFEIPDEFVIGYGLDFAERYRNLDCIGVLRPELQNPPVWQ